MRRDPPAAFQAIQASQLSDTGLLRRFVDELARITAWPTNNRPAAESKLDDVARFAKRTVRSRQSYAGWAEPHGVAPAASRS